MSTGEARKVSPQDLQLVQNLIERCLQLYMSQKDVVSTLLHQAKIEPSFTELVWQKLEEENQEFFKAYHLRLIVKQQIERFNRLLQRQAELMCQIAPIGAPSTPISNGSHILLSCYGTEHAGAAMKQENIPPSPGTSLPTAFTDDGPSVHPCMQTAIDMRNDVSPTTLLAQNSKMVTLQGTNAGMIKSEAGYAPISSFMYDANSNGLERHSTNGEAPISSFNSVESNAGSLNETILESDASAFGFLGQIPRNFSLSDLTADFSISSDILGSYSRSPFLATDTDNFLEPHSREHCEGPTATK